MAFSRAAAENDIFALSILFGLFQYLSRACLGKLIVFVQKWLRKVAFRTDVPQVRVPEKVWPAPEGKVGGVPAEDASCCQFPLGIVLRLSWQLDSSQTKTAFEIGVLRTTSSFPVAPAQAQGY